MFVKTRNDFEKLATSELGCKTVIQRFEGTVTHVREFADHGRSSQSGARMAFTLSSHYSPTFLLEIQAQNHDALYQMLRTVQPGQSLVFRSLIKASSVQHPRAALDQSTTCQRIESPPLGEMSFASVSQVHVSKPGNSRTLAHMVLLQCVQAPMGIFWTDGSPVFRTEVSNLTPDQEESIKSLPKTYLQLSFWGESRECNFKPGDIIVAFVMFKVPIKGLFPGILEGDVNYRPQFATAVLKDVFLRRFRKFQAALAQSDQEARPRPPLSPLKLESTPTKPTYELYTQRPATFNTQSDIWSQENVGDSLLSDKVMASIPTTHCLRLDSQSEDENDEPAIESPPLIVDETLSSSLHPFAVHDVVTSPDPSPPEDSAWVRLSELYEKVIRETIIASNSMDLPEAKQLGEHAIAKARKDATTIIEEIQKLPMKRTLEQANDLPTKRRNEIQADALINLEDALDNFMQRAKREIRLAKGVDP